MEVVETGEDMISIDVLAVFLDQICVALLVHQRRVPAQFLGGQIISGGTIPNVKALLRLEVLQTRLLHCLLKDLGVGLLGLHLVRVNCKVQVLIQLGVLQQSRQPRIEVGYHTQLALLRLQLLAELLKEFHAAVAWLPANGGFV